MPGMSVKQEKEYTMWVKDISSIKECKDTLKILRNQVETLKIMLAIPGDNLMGMKRRKKIKTKKKKKKKKKKKSKKNK
tara:strand:+ start:192 stop:425 length:234 start_codon:yes stop_codon:yes gene_type:complete